MIRILSIAAPVVLAALLVPVLQPVAEGCAPAPRPGYTIRIAEESAVIVWDAKNKIEHFIRRAAFDTKSPDFGFLVPTPTVPILAEVTPLLFTEMDRWIQPKTVEQTRFKFSPMLPTLCCLGGMAPPPKMSAAPGNVRILAEQKVGGFDSTVLEADDAEALAKWLKDHEYSAGPDLYAWLTPYVANKWKVTAFKVIQDEESGALAQTRPVRMSFKTDRPFFPYREPQEKPHKANDGNKPRPWHFDEKSNRQWSDRLLRVFFVSETRVDGALGNNPWHAELKWSDELSAQDRAYLQKVSGIADADVPAKAWMTTFEDRASPRPGKDEVYFDPAKDRTPVHPPPFISVNVLWIPGDLIFFCIIFMEFLVVWAIRRKVARTTPPPTPQRFSI